MFSVLPTLERITVSTGLETGESVRDAVGKFQFVFVALIFLHCIPRALRPRGGLRAFFMLYPSSSGHALNGFYPF